MVVTGVSTRSRQAVYPISPHTARMASGCSSVAHSPGEALKDGGDTRDHRVHLLDDRGFDAHTYRRCLENPNIRAPHEIDHEFCLT